MLAEPLIPAKSGIQMAGAVAVAHRSRVFAEMSGV